MQHDRFVKQIQYQARLSREEAEKAIRATLETLGECLDEGLAEHLAAHLPPQIARYLLNPRSCKQMMRGDIYDHLRLREGVAFSEAFNHARVVMAVLEETLPEVMDRVQPHLPYEFMPLCADSELQNPSQGERATAPAMASGQ